MGSKNSKGSKGSKSSFRAQAFCVLAAEELSSSTLDGIFEKMLSKPDVGDESFGKFVRVEYKALRSLYDKMEAQFAKGEDMLKEIEAKKSAIEQLKAIPVESAEVTIAISVLEEAIQKLRDELKTL